MATNYLWNVSLQNTFHIWEDVCEKPPVPKLLTALWEDKTHKMLQYHLWKEQLRPEKGSAQVWEGFWGCVPATLLYVSQ